MNEQRWVNKGAQAKVHEQRCNSKGARVREQTCMNMGVLAKVLPVGRAERGASQASSSAKQGVASCARVLPAVSGCCWPCWGIASCASLPFPAGAAVAQAESRRGSALLAEASACLLQHQLQSLLQIKVNSVPACAE